MSIQCTHFPQRAMPKKVILVQYQNTPPFLCRMKTIFKVNSKHEILDRSIDNKINICPFRISTERRTVQSVAPDWQLGDFAGKRRKIGRKICPTNRNSATCELVRSSALSVGCYWKFGLVKDDVLFIRYNYNLVLTNYLLNLNVNLLVSFFESLY